MICREQHKFLVKIVLAIAAFLTSADPLVAAPIALSAAKPNETLSLGEDAADHLSARWPNAAFLMVAACKASQGRTAVAALPLHGSEGEVIVFKEGRVRARGLIRRVAGEARMDMVWAAPSEPAFDPWQAKLLSLWFVLRPAKSMTAASLAALAEFPCVE